MIAHLYYRLRLLIACARFKYWHQVVSGQRRILHCSHPDDSNRLLKAMQARSKYRAKVSEVWR